MAEIIGISPAQDGALSELGTELSTRAGKNAGQRTEIERRMIHDLRQYQGRYESRMEEKLKAAHEATGASTIFLNDTRRLTDIVIARLTEILFPATDRNYAIAPTEVPTVQDIAAQMPPQDGAGMMIPEAQRMMMADEIRQRAEAVARERAEAMEDEITDQLTEADYGRVSRDVIEDACKVGTGIICGPININRERRRWQQIDGATYALHLQSEVRAGLRRVSPWDFYPDMSASSLGDAEFIFERSFLTPQNLLQRAKARGYRPEQIRKILERQAENPHGQAHTSWRQDLRAISGHQSTQSAGKRYELWTYTGPVDIRQLVNVGEERERYGDDSRGKVSVMVEMVGDVVIKISPLGQETEDFPYSVYNYAKAEASVFGYSVPYILRSPQTIINNAGRAMVDNAALSVGPQIVIDPHTIQPADGVWGLATRKIWFKNQSATGAGQPFESYDIASRQPELMEILMLGRRMAEDEVGAMDDRPTDPQSAETATKTRIRYNAAQVRMRNAVMQWDDDITTPLITRWYDWNMEYNEREDIKGDMEVKARGTSALLARELQDQALADLAMLTERPQFAGVVDPEKLLSRLFEANRLDLDDYRREEQPEAEPSGPTEQEIEAQRIAFEQQKHTDEMELARFRLAQEAVLKREELALKYETTAIEAEAKESAEQADAIKAVTEAEMTAAEIDLKERMGSGI